MVTTDQYNKLREQELILKAAKSGGASKAEILHGSLFVTFTPGFVDILSQELKSVLENVPRKKYILDEISLPCNDIDYNLDKFANGPFKVEITPPVIKETWEETNARQPKTQRKYFNPANNKWIGYG